MAPASLLSQLFLIAVFAPFATPSGIGADDVWALALLGAGQIGLGLALVLIGARLIPDGAGGPDLPARGRARPDLGVARVRGGLDTATLVGGAIVIVAILIQRPRALRPRGPRSHLPDPDWPCPGAAAGR